METPHVRSDLWHFDHADRQRAASRRLQRHVGGGPHRHRARGRSGGVSAGYAGVSLFRRCGEADGTRHARHDFGCAEPDQCPAGRVPGRGQGRRGAGGGGRDGRGDHRQHRGGRHLHGARGLRAGGAAARRHPAAASARRASPASGRGPMPMRSAPRLPALCNKLLAHAVVDGPATTEQAAIDWRETISSSRLDSGRSGRPRHGGKRGGGHAAVARRHRHRRQARSREAGPPLPFLGEPAGRRHRRAVAADQLLAHRWRDRRPAAAVAQCRRAAPRRARRRDGHRVRRLRLCRHRQCRRGRSLALLQRHPRPRLHPPDVPAHAALLSRPLQSHRPDHPGGAQHHGLRHARPQGRRRHPRLRGQVHPRPELAGRTAAGPLHRQLRRRGGARCCATSASSPPATGPALDALLDDLLAQVDAVTG